MTSNYNPSITSKISLFILVFCFMFSIPFVFTAGVGTRAIIGAAGLVYFFVHKLPAIRNILITGKFVINKYIFNIGLSLFSIMLMSFFVNFANNTSEKAFLLYPVSMILIFSGAYYVTDMMRKVYHRLDFELISSYFIRAVIVQLLIALIMFFIPATKIFIATIVKFDEIALSEMLKEGGFRLMGLGVQFFMAGIINCFALLLIAFRIKHYAKSFKDIFWLTISFIFVTAVGMIMSRTTMVGAGLAISMLVLGVDISHVRFRKFYGAIRTVCVIILICIPFFFSLSEKVREPLIKAGEYGFEMFVNYFETGKATTASSNELKTMYDTYPQKISTWIAGDGWFADPVTDGVYYMRVDVGYLRLIFYFGIVGLLLFLNYQYQMLRYINYLTDNRYKLFFFITFVLLLVLNLKGFADVTQLVALFICMKSDDPKKTVSLQL